MNFFSASLLREKFVIYDPHKGMADHKSTVTALSNRFVAELYNNNGTLVETYIVRAQNMHSCIRMVVRILQTFHQSGPIASRPEPFKWQQAWEQIVNDYEYAYNPARWVAIYHKGKCVFTTGQHHPLLDMIEKCDHENDKDYDYAVPLAETMFVQTGKSLKIEHDSNVALSTHFEANTGRLGIIQRGSNKTTTFTFTAQPKKAGQTLGIPQCLGGAAAFLEGIQLAFLVGMNTEKIRLGIIERFSKEEKQTREARQRLVRLGTEISDMETAFSIHYRPERPDFHHLVMDAEKLGQKVLVPPPPKAAEDDASDKV
jgi:hypothetical protein